jgi:hypothetical protein
LQGTVNELMHCRGFLLLEAAGLRHVTEGRIGGTFLFLAPTLRLGPSRNHAAAFLRCAMRISLARPPSLPAAIIADGDADPFLRQLRHVRRVRATQDPAPIAPGKAIEPAPLLKG